MSSKNSSKIVKCGFKMWLADDFGYKKNINHKLPNFATKEQQDQEPDAIVYTNAVCILSNCEKTHNFITLPF